MGNFSDTHTFLKSRYTSVNEHNKTRLHDLIDKAIDENLGVSINSTDEKIELIIFKAPQSNEGGGLDWSLKNLPERQQKKHPITQEGFDKWLRRSVRNRQ